MIHDILPSPISRHIVRHEMICGITLNLQGQLKLWSWQLQCGTAHKPRRACTGWAVPTDCHQSRQPRRGTGKGFIRRTEGDMCTSQSINDPSKSWSEMEILDRRRAPALHSGICETYTCCMEQEKKKKPQYSRFSLISAHCCQIMFRHLTPN